MEGGAQIVFGCRQWPSAKAAPAAIGQAHLDKTIASGLAHFGIEEAAFDGEHMNTGSVGGCGLPRAW